MIHWLYFKKIPLFCVSDERSMEWRQAMACVENSCKQISDTLSLHQRSKKRYIFELIRTPNLHENSLQYIVNENIHGINVISSNTMF